METKYYIGLDVHKKTISYCVKDGGVDTRHAIDPGHVDEDASTTVGGGHGSDHFHGTIISSHAAAVKEARTRPL